MEPFGLFNFFKTLLPLSDFSQNSTPSNMENQENIPFVKSDDAAKAAVSQETKNAPPAEENSETQNAFTNFMEAHDARAKRTRKHP